MTHLPPSVTREHVIGLECLHRGKVRDTYGLPGHQGHQLVVASDRLSIFDFVLPAMIPGKGAVLTAMNHFWRSQIGELFVHDLVACGVGIDDYLPPNLRGDIDLQARASVVSKLHMLPCEAIVRGCLTGSGLVAYERTSMVCGHDLPNGLRDGDRLPFPIFTPTTKATEGHDEHLTADHVADKWGSGMERRSLQLFELARAYAATRGIILADTKFEWGSSPMEGYVLGDEVLTPDSSRFWDARAWHARDSKLPRRSPPSFDKQLVREWGKLRDIHKRDPRRPEDREWIDGLEVQRAIVEQTVRTYRYIFWRLTGEKLETYQLRSMGLDVKPPIVKVEVVSGSASDVEQMYPGLLFLHQEQEEGSVQARRHVISCHRNPEELANYVRDLSSDTGVIIAGAGMAAALPGISKSLLIKAGKGHIPVIGVAFKGQTEDATRAAQLSIEQLPGRPVTLSPEGRAYTGAEGFLEACIAAVRHEFLCDPPANDKPAQLDLPLIVARPPGATLQ